ncbi:cytosine permease [Bradyrhizobium sp.]|uniref:purine-cytosine permease family protein n=1 Tax=Bradyrhizobium sp. TaxID=376 RepID=UPI0026113D0F|nr:cytosine permease [Bradyrhizobium sp.]
MSRAQNLTEYPNARGAVAATEDHANVELPKQEQRSTLSVTIVRMGFTVSATDLLFGMSLGLFFHFWTAVAVSAISSIIISVTSILVGLIGQREGLTTPLATLMVFGREGCRVPSLVLGVVWTGFVGYSTAITADVLPGHTPGWWLFYVVVLSAIYAYLNASGFAKGLLWVSRISVPVMLVAVLIAVVAAVNHAGGLSNIINGTPVELGKAGFATMVGLGAAKWLTGATTSPDITRFAKSSAAVYTTTIAEFIVGNLGFNLLGIIIGAAVGTAQMAHAFSTIGLASLGALAIFVQGFPHEVNGGYSASVGIRTALSIPRLYACIIVAVGAAILAYYGLTEGVLKSFLHFLGYIAYAIPLIPGIMIGDYFLLHRGHYEGRVADAQAVNWRAMWAFIIGLVISVYLGVVLHDVLWRSLPVIGFVVYLILSWKQLVAAWTKPTSSP